METQSKEDKILLLSGERNDGNVVILLSENRLELKADFYPPLGDGKPLAAGDISGALVRFNVVHGILWEEIQNAVNLCNLDRMRLKDVSVARGDPPVDEVHEYFQLVPDLKAAREPDDMEKVDHHAWSPFIIVKKEQELARLVPHREGRDGRDIYGEIIPHGVFNPQGVLPGPNTRGDGRCIYAEAGGQLILDKNILKIQEKLVIKGGVDYRTGHIMFPGDVFIGGPVSDGFKIYSGGSVTIKETFDASDVVVKNDLTVSGGIIGRGRAMLKIGGALNAKFVENCRAACRKSVTLSASIVNSSVYTLESVELGDKGRILGGEIYAVKGIRAGAIGKKSGRTTKIHCGVDFTALQEKEKCNYRLKTLSQKLNKLHELLDFESSENPEPAPGSPESERRQKMEGLVKKFEEEQARLSGRLRFVLGKINAYEDAVVEVKGIIAPGTLIEICQIALFVSDQLSKVRIRLDRGQGRLVAEGLK